LILEESRKCEAEVLAIGGLADHIHLLVRMPAKLGPAEYMQRVKGVSSTSARNDLLPGELFRWQEGYGVFSVSRSHVSRVAAYVHNQKLRHAKESLWPDWERTNDD
jgi:REP element-mobilizing transposase RayT